MSPVSLSRMIGRKQGPESWLAHITLSTIVVGETTWSAIL